MKPSEILTKAADLIEPENAWAKGWYAYFTDEDGNRVECGDVVDFQKANCWCAAGAINRAALPYDEFSDIRERAKYALISVIDDRSHSVIVPDEIIANWNDNESRTQSEVVSALRAAAELAKQQEAV